VGTPGAACLGSDIHPNHVRVAVPGLQTGRDANQGLIIIIAVVSRCFHRSDSNRASVSYSDAYASGSARSDRSRISRRASQSFRSASLITKPTPVPFAELSESQDHIPHCDSDNWELKTTSRKRPPLSAGRFSVIRDHDALPPSR
jgi:hypothetical protein